jgi:hypothetical protein
MKKRLCYHSSSWHVAINFHVKHSLHGVSVNSVGFHDVSVHEEGMHTSVGVHCMGMHRIGTYSMNIPGVGTDKKDSYSAVIILLIISAYLRRTHFFLLHVIE